ncbi:hypothetical protein GCM10022252_74810 [Streptosporangium oxazolinicum]|uniref:Uncharacterized protein n=1 Tax=Streptosporangium oxazolinicum TaxID=909287 RepID=A0ABP8BK82_9ACTN
MTKDPSPPGGYRPGDRELDVLREAADAAHREIAEHITVTTAEGVVASARVTQLAEASRKAYRKISSMRGQLTRAQKDGDAEKIAAAHRKLEQAKADFDQVSEAGIAEGHQIVQAGLERMDTTFALMDKSWAAGDQVIEALGRPKPSR